MSKQRRNNAPYDDGRIVAKMNIPGMPGYTGSAGHNINGREYSTLVDGSAVSSAVVVQYDGPSLTKKETRSVMFHALGWAFLYAGIYVIALVLFVLLYLY